MTRNEALAVRVRKLVSPLVETPLQKEHKFHKNGRRRHLFGLAVEEKVDVCVVVGE